MQPHISKEVFCKFCGKPRPISEHDIVKDIINQELNYMICKECQVKTYEYIKNLFEAFDLTDEGSIEFIRKRDFFKIIVNQSHDGIKFPTVHFDFEKS